MSIVTQCSSLSWQFPGRRLRGSTQVGWKTNEQQDFTVVINTEHNQQQQQQKQRRWDWTSMKETDEGLSLLTTFVTSPAVSTGVETAGDDCLRRRWEVIVTPCTGSAELTGLENDGPYSSAGKPQDRTRSRPATTAIRSVLSFFQRCYLVHRFPVPYFAIGQFWSSTSTV